MANSVSTIDVPDAIAFLGVLAVVIGWFITSIVTRRVAVESFKRDVKRKLYESFIEEVWKSRAQIPGTKVTPPISNVEISKYSNKIALYGSTAVVKLLAKALAGGKSDTENMQNLTDLISGMRRDVGEKVDKSTSDDISGILYTRPKPK